MSDKKKYRLLADTMQYKSAKDGKERYANKGDVVDDLLPVDAKELLAWGSIEVVSIQAKEGVSE